MEKWHFQVHMGESRRTAIYHLEWPLCDLEVVEAHICDDFFLPQGFMVQSVGAHEFYS